MMAAKKRRSRGPGLVWRVAFGPKGPTARALKAEMKKGAARLLGPKEYAFDQKTQQLVPVKAGKKAAAKKTTASRASKPSRSSQPSRAGQVQRRATSVPTVAATPRRLPEAQSMKERHIRNPDGTFDGSKRDPRKAALEYQQIMQHVAELEAMTDRDLGWDREV